MNCLHVVSANETTIVLNSKTPIPFFMVLDGAVATATNAAMVIALLFYGFYLSRPSIYLQPPPRFRLAHIPHRPRRGYRNRRCLRRRKKYGGEPRLPILGCANRRRANRRNQRSGRFANVLRARHGIVSQDAILFHDSVMGNLLIAKSGGTEMEIHEACDISRIHDFICSLPEGYGAVVGERGVKLSGSQRQRISIARAVLRNPDILLLDEATSHLDSEAESAVQSALNSIASLRTTIVIAKAESGAHTGLLSCEGVYLRLWDWQTIGDVVGGTVEKR